MKAQTLYDLRTVSEFCSVSDLAEFFENSLGDPSPRGDAVINDSVAADFIAECISAMKHDGPSLFGL